MLKCLTCWHFNINEHVNFTKKSFVTLGPAYVHVRAAKAILFDFYVPPTIFSNVGMGLPGLNQY